MYKRAVLDCLIELFFDLEWPARIRLLSINEMDLVDLYYECCRLSNEASEFIIQEIIYYQLCEVAKGAPNNRALTSYPLMLTTSYAHTMSNIKYSIRNITITYVLYDCQRNIRFNAFNRMRIFLEFIIIAIHPIEYGFIIRCDFYANIEKGAL